MRLLDADSQPADERHPPELVIIAQSRPGAIGHQLVQRLQNEVPLAGIVGLLGSWCEGETRTGRPWPGVNRIYWYNFPSWWRRQIALRTSGRCPDWLRPAESVLQTASCELSHANVTRGVIAVCTQWRETADALADVLKRAGYATIWQHPCRELLSIRGAIAGIWEGGQLERHERIVVTHFCGLLARDAAPVVALLDFPRRQSVDLARECGVAAVMGKPWRNDELMATIQTITGKVQRSRAA
jgi:hypothetical protein